MKELLARLMTWRPALPAVCVSGLGYLVQAGRAVWSSFWAVWNNPSTYLVIGLVAFGMFTAGYREGRDHVTAVRADLKDARAELAETKNKLGAAQINEQAARDAAKAALAKLAALEKSAAAAEPAKTAPPVKVKAKVEPKKPQDSGWKLF